MTVDAKVKVSNSIILSDCRISGDPVVNKLIYNPGKLVPGAQDVARAELSECVVMDISNL